MTRAVRLLRLLRCETLLSFTREPCTYLFIAKLPVALRARIRCSEGRSAAMLLVDSISTIVFNKSRYRPFERMCLN